MTNRIALFLALFLLALFIVDMVLNGGRASLFIGKKFLDLVDHVKFWR